MKRGFKMILLMLCLVTVSGKVSAQIAVLEIVKAGVKKIIKAVDLKVQRLQNETVWLQNAQKAVENTMSKTKLGEISGWVGRQRDLYRDYYEELAKVKAVIFYYRRVKDIATRQVALVQLYSEAWGMLKKDKHFRPAELDYMEKVYAGILEESARNLDQIMMVVNSFRTQMTDGQRLEIINRAAEQTEINYFDLKQFNQQCMALSVARASSRSEAQLLRKMYGIQ